MKLASMGIRRRYSDEDRAQALAALAANNGNTNKTAEQIGVPEATLRLWAKTSAVPAEVCEQKKKDLASRLDDLAHALIDDLARPERIAEADYQKAATALGIAMDKAALLRGQGQDGDKPLVQVLVYLPGKDNGQQTNQTATSSGSLPQKLG